MSRTTSAKCVKLNLRPSRYSKVASITLTILVIFFILVSSIPTFASLFLIIPLVIATMMNQVLLPALQGEVEFISALRLKDSQGEYLIDKVNFVVMAFGLIITKEDNRRAFLWRDSLPEAEYRHLVVMLKREH